MFFRLPFEEDRKRESLPQDISSWPPCNESKRWFISLDCGALDETHDAYSNTQEILEAKLGAALTRPDIDTLSLYNTCTPSQAVKNLVVRLLAQDRGWKVHYFCDERGPDLRCDLPLIANQTSCITHLDLIIWGVPKAESPAYCAFLLGWQIQMRNIRFVCIRITSCNVYSFEIEYVSRVHARWLQWQSYLRENLPTTPHSSEGVAPSLAEVDQKFWANELRRCDQTRNPELRPLSLDAMNFLLQQWLSGVSNIPSV